VSAASRQAARAEAGRSEPSAPSGRLLLRMPRSLHGALTDAAEREGTSLNQFITGTLASAIAWTGEGADARPRPQGPAQAGPSRALLAVLVVNAVAVGLAALGAVGILLLAWLG
jgi:HicB-like protein involved in pilus formation